MEPRPSALVERPLGDADNSAAQTPCNALLGDNSDRITLVGLVFETSQGLRRCLARTIEDELGIAGQSFDILVRLIRSPNGQLRMTDLAAQTGLSPSGLTRAIDRLVEVNFLERLSCPSDRRGTFAVLTAQGRARTEEVLSLHRSEIDEVLAGVLSPVEEATLVSLLRCVRDRVQPDATLVTSDERGSPSTF